LANKKKQAAEARLQKVTHELNQLKMMLQQAEEDGDNGDIGSPQLTESLRFTNMCGSGEFGPMGTPATPQFFKDLAAISGNSMAVPAQLGSVAGRLQLSRDSDRGELEQPSIGRIGHLYNSSRMNLSMIDPNDLSCSPPPNLSPIVGQSESPHNSVSPVPCEVQSLISMFERKLESFDGTVLAKVTNDEAPAKVVASAKAERKPLANLSHNLSHNSEGGRNRATTTLRSNGSSAKGGHKLPSAGLSESPPADQKAGAERGERAGGALRQTGAYRVQGKENKTNTEHNTPLRGKILAKKTLQPARKKTSVLLSNGFRPKSFPFARQVRRQSSRRLKTKKSNKKQKRSKEIIRHSKGAGEPAVESDARPRPVDIDKMLEVQHMSEIMAERLRNPCLTLGGLNYSGGSNRNSGSQSVRSSYATANEGDSMNQGNSVTHVSIQSMVGFSAWGGEEVFNEVKRSAVAHQDYSCFQGKKLDDEALGKVDDEESSDSFFHSAGSASAFHSESLESTRGGQRAMAYV
jgi:hypothetical protein